jgi:hypothetical protein
MCESSSCLRFNVILETPPTLRFTTGSVHPEAAAAYAKEFLAYVLDVEVQETMLLGLFNMPQR